MKESRNLNRRITVRLSKEDYAALRRMKNHTGDTFATLARRALFEKYGIGDPEE